MNQKELDLKFLFNEMAELIQGWMTQMASIGIPVRRGVLAMAAILKEHEEILLDTLKEMIEEGYPI